MEAVVESPPKKSKRIAALIVVFIILFGGLGYYTFSLSAELEETNATLGELSQKISRVEANLSSRSQSKVPTDLASLVSEVNKLSSQVEALGKSGLEGGALVSELYRQAEKSVVLVTVRVEGGGQIVGSGEGTGIVFDTLGRIITNNHVVEDAEIIEVTFSDGTVVDAHILGSDPFSDLAVIEVNEVVSDLHPLRLGDSSNLEVGERVIAIGNPFGLSGSVTSGIVSQTGRLMPAPGGYSITNVIQIDAAVNPGNSGGPLLNGAGEVVGITTAIASRTGGFSGVGFAIPSNTVTREIPVLIAEGSYTHPFLGIRAMNIRPEISSEMNLLSTKGLLIVELSPGGPAATAGLKAGSRTITIDGIDIKIGGDVVVAVDEFPVAKFDDLISFVEENRRPGDTIKLTIIRDGEVSDISITLGERPEL
ncbi:MAG: S1C family serine protease [Candidatus Bathyarchaeia archaeon]